jgi:hypothetical protein
LQRRVSPPGPRAKPLILLVVSGTFWLATLSAIANPPDIDDIKWLHEGADPIAALTMIRAECIQTTTDSDRAHAIQLGRIAFRSPVLLGGLAARVGMSCNSCHPNGHDNPAFYVVGVSGEPGTADVTGSVFSTARDDHIFNPVPIPSLVDVANQSSFGSVLTVPDLATFLNTAIVGEFQGQTPPKSITDGLLAYLTSLQSAACMDPGPIAVSFESDALELRATLDSIFASLDRDDLRAAEFVLLSLRAALGRVYRRFPESVTARKELIDLSMALADARRRLAGEAAEEGEEGEPDVKSILSSVRERLEALIQKLAIQVSESFYDASQLRRVLGLAP